MWPFLPPSCRHQAVSLSAQPLHRLMHSNSIHLSIIFVPFCTQDDDRPVVAVVDVYGGRPDTSASTAAAAAGAKGQGTPGGAALAGFPAPVRRCALHIADYHLYQNRPGLRLLQVIGKATVCGSRARELARLGEVCVRAISVVRHDCRTTEIVDGQWRFTRHLDAMRICCVVGFCRMQAASHPYCCSEVVHILCRLCEHLSLMRIGRVVLVHNAGCMAPTQPRSLRGPFLRQPLAPVLDAVAGGGGADVRSKGQCR